MKGILIIAGLCCAGKTTIGEYFGHKQGFKFVNLRRIFESLVGKENAHSIHQDNCNNLLEGKVEWLNVIRDHTQTFKSPEILVIEGLNNPDEIKWIEQNFRQNVSIIFVENTHRLDRYILRDEVDYITGFQKLQSNDNWRKEQNLDVLKSYSVFYIDNSDNLDNLFEQCDEIEKIFTQVPHVCTLCHYVNKKGNYHFIPSEIVYFIRQLSIAHGCKNACSHCFAAAPNVIEQTQLEGFKNVINEIGSIIAQNNKALSFFHLGASTDPASVRNYAEYLKEWIAAFPKFQKIKIFTHGWSTTDQIEEDELRRTISIIQQAKRDIRIVISFDCFSMKARTNWDDYVDNICKNVKIIIENLGSDVIRIEAFYPPARNEADSRFTLEYWRNIFKHNNQKNTLQEAMQLLSKYEDDNQCAKVTRGVLTIFHRCGISCSEIFDKTRDCEMIFNSGRGMSLFTNSEKTVIDKGFEIQKRRVLYSLKNYCYGNQGLIIYPDGSVRMVDYEGYVLGEWINDRNPVLHCLRVK